MDKRYEIKLDEKNKKLLVDTMDEFDKHGVLVMDSTVLSRCEYKKMIEHVQNGYVTEADIFLLNTLVETDAKFMLRRSLYLEEHKQKYWYAICELRCKVLETQMEDYKKQLQKAREKQKCRE